MTDPIVLPESKIRLDGGPNVYGAFLDPIQRKSGMARRGETWVAWRNGHAPEFEGTREECIERLDDWAVECQMARRSS